MVSTHDIKAFNDIIESTLAISKYYENIDNINTNIILTLMVSQTLLVFSNLDKNKKENAILRVYELEKKLKQQSQFQMYNERKEVSILNNALMQKKFKKAILLSNIYKKLYNNNFIRSIYKKYRSNLLKVKIFLLKIFLLLCVDYIRLYSNVNFLYIFYLKV